jgi:hypothetical protein
MFFPGFLICVAGSTGVRDPAQRYFVAGSDVPYEDAKDEGFAGCFRDRDRRTKDLPLRCLRIAIRMIGNCRDQGKSVVTA